MLFYQLARRASARSKSSVKKVQSVFIIIHEVDALPRDIDESEQGPAAGAHVVQQHFSHLMPVVAFHFGLDQVSVSAVYGQDVSVRGNLQSERTVQSAALENRHSCSIGSVALQRILDGDDAVVESVGYVKHAAVAIVVTAIGMAESKSCRSDHQRGWIGPLRET